MESNLRVAGGGSQAVPTAQTPVFRHSSAAPQTIPACIAIFALRKVQWLEECRVVNETDKQAAALLIHGLGGTEYDLGALGNMLQAGHICARSPLLPGHGTNPKDLLRCHWQDWVNAMRAEYRALKEKHGEVHLAGVCLGALVALEVARLEQHEGKLAVYAPPLFLDGWSIPKKAWLRHVVYWLPALARRMKVPECEPYGIKNPRIRRAIQQRFERNENFHYAYIPLACVREVDRLRKHLVARLGEIRCQTLVVHAREDEITSMKSARYLRRHLAGAVEVMPLTNSYHMVMVDSERAAVLQRSQRFFGAAASAAVGKV